MAVTMKLAYRHPKTGVFWVRKVVPEHLRASLGRREFKRTLGTKDERQAMSLMAPVLEGIEREIEAGDLKLRAAKARADGCRVSLKALEIARVLSGAYEAKVAEHADDPGSPEHWCEFAAYYADTFTPDHDDDAGPRTYSGDRHIREEVEGIFAGQGMVLDAPTLGKACSMWAREMIEFGQRMERRANGDWRGTMGTERFPKAPSVSTAPAPIPVPLADLVAGWARETGKGGKALYDRERTAETFKAFLGHDDAARVTADDVVRWKESRLAAGKSPKTVANDINELSPIWKWAKRNRKLTFAENPFAGLAPLKKPTAQRPRQPYTSAEARTILETARGEGTALLRWLPWLLCFTGARLGEVLQSDKGDFAPVAGLPGTWAFHIHGDGPGRSLKTPQSRRYVPLHPALIAEGFLAYLDTIPAGPLFPAVKLDKFGTRKGRGGNTHSKWVRETVGLTDTTKDPAHAHRHLWEDRAREAGMPQNVADALMGHLNAANEAEGYGRGFKFMPETTAGHVRAMGNPAATDAPE